MNTKLDDWALILCGDEFTAPELRSVALCGTVTGHPRHVDGKHICTSTIIGKRNGLVITHSGTAYELGLPKADYEAAYPGAAERLMERLNAV